MTPDETIRWFGIELPVHGLLNYETFNLRNERNPPIYNNFVLYWDDGISGEWQRGEHPITAGSRKARIYHMFKSENLELDTKLRQLVPINLRTRNFDAITPTLYEAYGIMKRYVIDGEPVTNHPDLFA